MTKEQLVAWGADLANRFNAALPASDPDKDVRTGSALFAHDGVESAARQLRRIELLQPSRIVEIGTGKGTTTAILAKLAQHVLTVDIGPYPLRRQIWDWTGADNIVAVMVDGNPSKAMLICDHCETFDVGFVDGDHSEQGCEFDFTVCHKAGVHAVLFHDFTPPYENGVTALVQKLDKGQIIEDYPFAWWVAHPDTVELLRAVR